MALRHLRAPRPRAFGGDADYRLAHQAPGADTGAPLHDLTARGVYPRDFYDRMYEYRPHHESDDMAMATIRAKRGRPDAPVQVCRAVPKGVKDIQPGDWVAITRAYARDHGRHGSDPSRDMPVICARTQARNLYTAGDSFQEWGYGGTAPLRGTVVFRPRRVLTVDERKARNLAAQRKRRLARERARQLESGLQLFGARRIS